MKIFFMSDIHGSAFFLKKAIDAYERENCKYMVLLGDILYSGPRNNFPKDYEPKEVLRILNKYADKIIAVRGNCDSEVDQMVLDFPILSDYSYLIYNNRRLFLTHGHIYNRDNFQKAGKDDVLIHGHTHIPIAEKVEDRLILNPGSISLPKNNSSNSYAILEDNTFTVKDLDGNPFLSTQL